MYQNRGIHDAKKKGKQGVCVISSKKKKSYLADKKFFLKYGFEVVDQIEDYAIKTSAGIPNLLCRFLIIGKVRLRLPLSTS